VGVRTLAWTHPNQPDILKAQAGTAPPYDRPLKAEVWYPARLAGDEGEVTTYHDALGRPNDPKRPLVPFAFGGRARRDAPPLAGRGAFPLVIVSHGYPGSRVLLTYLTENLASKGYVVVALDHTESTHADVAGFASTLLHRPFDILFALAQMSESGQPRGKHFLSGLVDANRTALIGYSMGGYGVLNVGGAGFSNKLLTFFGSLTGGNQAIAVRTGSHPGFAGAVDSRIKAIVAFAPWGMEREVWDAQGLSGLKLPTFFVAGSQDDVSGYERGIKALYEGAINADRYLLTYVNARHNVAPNPPPGEAGPVNVPLEEYYHYAEPAWNERRINNINQHFVTAFLDLHLKQKDTGKYLDLPLDANQKGWTGFKPRTATGMEFRHAPPQR
jgi:predicted dienelactone hydrolase